MHATYCVPLFLNSSCSRQDCPTAVLTALPFASHLLLPGKANCGWMYLAGTRISANVRHNHHNHNHNNNNNNNKTARYTPALLLPGTKGPDEQDQTGKNGSRW